MGRQRNLLGKGNIVSLYFDFGKQEFYKEDDAKKAVKKLNKEDINGYTLVVELAKGRK